jgi:hypothetical protein
MSTASGEQIELSIKRRVPAMVLVAVLAVYAALSVRQNVLNTLTPRGAQDLNAYWYAGHFVRQMRDPYGATLLALEPEFPVRYVDGAIAAKGPIRRPDIQTLPTNTAPMILLMAPLALFSWPVAKSHWLVFNLTMMLVVPFMAFLVAERYGLRLRGVQKWLVALVFVCMFPTRNAVGLGQNSLPVVAAMLAVLYWQDRHDLLAGILFGLALSKYSLALPLLVYLLYRRKIRVLAVGVVVQLVGLLLLALICRVSPLQIGVGYLAMFHAVASSNLGIHLAALFPPRLLYQVGILVVGGGFLLYLWRGIVATRVDEQFGPGDFHLLAVLSLWSLLITYHGYQDMVLVILFFIAAFCALDAATPWALSGHRRWLMLVGVSFSAAVLSAPHSLILALSPVRQSAMYSIWSALPTLTLLAMLGLATWLLQVVCSFTERVEHG